MRAVFFLYSSAVPHSPRGCARECESNNGITGSSSIHETCILSKGQDGRNTGENLETHPGLNLTKEKQLLILIKYKITMVNFGPAHENKVNSDCQSKFKSILMPNHILVGFDPTTDIKSTCIITLISSRFQWPETNKLINKYRDTWSNLFSIPIEKPSQSQSLKQNKASADPAHWNQINSTTTKKVMFDTSLWYKVNFDCPRNVKSCSILESKRSVFRRAYLNSNLFNQTQDPSQPIPRSLGPYTLNIFVLFTSQNQVNSEPDSKTWLFLARSPKKRHFQYMYKLIQTLKQCQG